MGIKKLPKLRGELPSPPLLSEESCHLLPYSRGADSRGLVIQ